MNTTSYLMTLTIALATSTWLPSLKADNTLATRLLLKWQDGPGSSAAAVGNAAIGSRVRRNLNTIGWQVVELPPGMSVSSGLRAYRALSAVLAVEPDNRMPADPPRLVITQDSNKGPHPLFVPNDPIYRLQWHLQKIWAAKAWDITTGSTNVVVAIVDTGVDYNHPELAPNLWRNPGETGLDANGHDKATNGIDDDGDGYVDDVYGVDIARGTGDPMDTGIIGLPGHPATAPAYHGTFIAGLIGAVGNNAMGVVGLNWSVQMMSIRTWGGDVTDLQGHSDFPFYSDMVAGFDYVVAMKRRGVNVRVVNHSSTSFIPGLALRDAMAALDQEGIICCIAAGNYAANNDLYPNFPNCFNFPSILSVAETDSSDSLNSFSCYGPSTVQVAAPGIGITSTWKGGGYATNLDGTSFATPMVAGSAALLLSAHPELTVDQIKAVLFGSVDPIPGLKGKVMTGGRLNLGRAFDYLTNNSPPAIVVTPLPIGRRIPPGFPIQVTFNRPMNRASVEAAFVVQPAITGRFEWSVDGRTVFFHHELLFDTRTNYTVRILGSAQDEAGGTLDGNYNRILQGSPADDFTWTFRFPVPNDDFADATPLTGATGSIAGNNRYTTWDIADPQLSGTGALIRADTVWYCWTPPQEGWFTFDLTKGNSFDTLMDVYIGDNIESLSPVASNDNHGPLRGSRTSFAAWTNSGYYIRVAGKDVTDLNQSGAFALDWYPTPPPVFSAPQVSSAAGTIGTKVTLYGTNFTGATAVLFNGASTSFTNGPTNYQDLRITATVPSDAISGPITVVTPHGIATSTVSFQVPPPRLSVTFDSSPAVRLHWLGTSKAWILMQAEDLLTGPWLPVQETPVISADETTVTLPRSTENHFYRLKRDQNLAR
jgi:subtilisin family serine protease